jgi:hypothetical protein
VRLATYSPNAIQPCVEMSEPVLGNEVDARTSTEKDVALHDAKDSSKDVDLEASSPANGETDSEPEIIVARELQQRFGLFRSLRRGEEWLDAKMGIETRGIDRIPEEDKKPPSIINM